jgi:hypothetical protein
MIILAKELIKMTTTFDGIALSLISGREEAKPFFAPN